MTDSKPTTDRAGLVKRAVADAADTLLEEIARELATQDRRGMWEVLPPASQKMYRENAADILAIIVASKTQHGVKPTMTDSLDLDKLERLAEAADPDEVSNEGHNIACDDYYAAIPPDVARALIARVSQARRDALEEAAKKADALASHWHECTARGDEAVAAERCAIAIRKLLEEPHCAETSRTV